MTFISQEIAKIIVVLRLENVKGSTLLHSFAATIFCFFFSAILNRGKNCLQGPVFGEPDNPSDSKAPFFTQGHF